METFEVLGRRLIRKVVLQFCQPYEHPCSRSAIASLSPVDKRPFLNGIAWKTLAYQWAGSSKDRFAAMSRQGGHTTGKQRDRVYAYDKYLRILTGDET